MKIGIYILIIIVLVATGFWLYKDFFEFSLSMLNTENINLFSRAIAGQLNSELLFVLSLVSIPILYLLIERTTKIVFLYKGAIASLIITITGILFWRLRIFSLNTQFEELTKYNLPEEIIPQFNVGDLKFTIYLLMGFIVGALISILIFRDKSKPLLN